MEMSNETKLVMYKTPNGETQVDMTVHGETIWLIFLYNISNISKMGCRQDLTLADKIYYLNRIMHSVDVYHQVELPSLFFLEHPVGTVLGRAKYCDGFMAYQNSTAGGNIREISH